MSKHTGQSISGQFQQLIYSPKGHIEGILLRVEEEPVQVVFEKHHDAAACAFDDVEDGQALSLEVRTLNASPKGKGEHRVVGFIRLTTINGRKPTMRKQTSARSYSGVVIRLNCARHGACNGVVLDSGDFIHTKPAGMARLKLNIGDPVCADGESRALAGGRDRAIEAVRVNGKKLKLK